MLSRLAALLITAAFILGTALLTQQPTTTPTAAACDYSREDCVIEGWMF
ncbi:hypothetical protein P8605_19855 [Streptomyces sp. T-3]|nr:hypothetical protein [Streptomyces sp. T-3]